MSEDQIKRILERLDDQDKKSQEQLNAQFEVWKDFRQELKNLNAKIESVSSEVKPVVQLANSVKGFDQISKWIFKFLLGVAALITALGTILLFVKKLITGSWGV